MLVGYLISLVDLIWQIAITYWVIKRDSVDCHEMVQIVFVWHIVPVPSHYIEWTMVLFHLKEFPLEFGNYFVTSCLVFEMSRGM